MKKQLLTKTLLMAVMLLGGANFAWGDGSKRTLNSQDYESAVTTDWTCPNAHTTLISNDPTYGTYAKSYFDNDGSGNRSCYKSVSFAATAGSGYTTSAMSTAGYNIECDILLQGSTQKSSGAAQFIVPTTGPNLATNAQYTGTNYIFSLSQSNGDSETYRKTGWYINDLTNSTGSTATLSYTVWYHLKLVVTTSSVTYTITNNSTSAQIATGSKTVEALPTITGFFGLVGRNSGIIQFDNLDIYDYIDAEGVSAPAFDVAYAGTNRTITITGGTSSKSNAVTTYYTTNGSTPSSSNYAGSFTTTTKDVTISSDCTVKAISISSTDVESTVSSRDITVGKLTLNAPTFTKTAYSAGTSYTYTIASDQSGLDFVPASTTIKYRIGETGDYSTYSSGVSVDEGEILYAYVEATDYNNSSVASITAVSLPAMARVFGQNFVGVVKSDMSMNVSAGPTVTNSVSTADANYFIPSSDGTNALTNENISFYFSYDSGDTSKNKYWQLKTTGVYSAFGRGSANVKISNLIVGQIVKVRSSNFNSVTGLTKLDAYSCGDTNYYVATATTAYISISRHETLYSVDVYTLDNETVGSLDCTSNYYSAWNTTPIWINAGETAYYKFKNYNNASSKNLYENWYLYAANESSTNVAIFGPNHTNTADGSNGSYTSRPTFTMSDLNGATVELTATLADAGDDTYTLTVTGVTTKADGSTTLSPNLVYTQKGLTVSKLKLYISPEKNWLELLQEAVKKNITSAGYATYYSNNALDFANATPSLTASLITGTVGATTTLALDDVDDVPAETGVLLAGDEATYTIPVIATSSTVTTSNKLEGVHVATEIDAETGYVLMGSPKVGFYMNNNAFTVGANTAYLPADFAGARMAFFGFDETTGISLTENSELRTENAVYDLQGRRVMNAQKGLYIVNGKKVVIK